MSKDFQQEDTAAPLGTVAACSGFVVAGTPIGRLAVDGGTAGTGAPQFKFTNPQSADEGGVMFEIDPGEDVPLGDHIMRIRITTTNTNITWSECWCCWWNGSVYSELGKVQALGHVLDTAQTETATISSASASPTYSADDRLYYVLVFDSAGAHGSNAANFTPDQLITTPISVGGLGMPLCMHYRKQMAVK